MKKMKKMTASQEKAKESRQKDREMEPELRFQMPDLC